MSEPEEGATPWSFGEGDALKEIADWIAGRRGWQQQALRWLLDEEKLSDSQLDSLLSMALDGKAASDPVKAGDLRMAEAAKQTVILCSVDQTRHVNALVPDQRLSFCQRGLTVIYGRNGSGKSGYARILKHACRARRPDKDAILPDIDEASPGTPTALIKYSVNGNNRHAMWSQGAETDAAVSAVSVFDSSTAPIHVNEVNEVAYTPYPLELLERLAAASNALKERAIARKRAIEQQTPQLLKEPPTGTDTAVGKLLASLSATTDETKVRALAQLSAGERRRLDVLKHDLAGDPEKNARQLVALRSELLRFKELLEKLVKATAAEAIERLWRSRVEREAARQAANLAAARDFADEPLRNVGSEAWRRLWEAARRYAGEEVYPGRPFPATDPGDRCVLCHQDLAPSAADRLRRFEASVQDDTEAEAKRAATRSATLEAELADALPRREALLRLRAAVNDRLGEPEAARSIARCLIQLRWNGRCALRDRSDQPLALVDAEPFAALAELDRLSTNLETRAVALTSEAGSGERRRLLAEVKELEDRVWLESIIEDVIAEIGRRKELENIARVMAECATNAITAKATGLTEKLITGALRRRFQEEVTALGVHHAGVELKRETSRLGVPRFRVRFVRNEQAAVGRVLSEGEFRAVALAAFMAELTTAGGRSAIIFDDPVSSLDNEHREHVARRLVREAEGRQVIVFTHDIAFLLQVDRVSVEADTDKPQYRSISRGSVGPGVCSSEAPHHARSVPDVLAAIERDLDNRQALYERGQDHDWRIAVRSFSEQLRECWERAVEDFIGPVCRRMGTVVKAAALNKLVGLTEEDCTRMRRGYQRCSELLHSAPEVIDPPLPTPDRIKAAISEIREWHRKLCGNRS